MRNAALPQCTAQGELVIWQKWEQLQAKPQLAVRPTSHFSALWRSYLVRTGRADLYFSQNTHQCKHSLCLRAVWKLSLCCIMCSWLVAAKRINCIVKNKVHTAKILAFTHSHRPVVGTAAWERSTLILYQCTLKGRRTTNLIMSKNIIYFVVVLTRFIY